MDNMPKQENAVAAIRISSTKQGLQGDSPQAQTEQIDAFAKAHNINIKKYFIFMESASKEKQPVQEAIDYCKDSKNDIQLFIVKSIDRFTRGGSYLYDFLKMQLVGYGVKLVDIYGIISSQQVNTLEHLDIEFNWSVYSPSKKSEILEAERAKDEIRDILTRMIGAEIRYVRMGYRVRPAPFGYVNEKIETAHGRRVILIPHPIESKWIIKMFELRVRGTLKDPQIVEEINRLGFKSRRQYKRNPADRTKIIGEKGGTKLNLKQFWRYIQSPIFAGINIEKWTKDQPVKGNFPGLVPIEMFNEANRGKMTIVEEDGKITIYTRKPPEWVLKRGHREAEFAYKRYVMCPICEKPPFGSSTRGKSGKHYPAYHCNKRGHYFRVSKKDMDETVEKFVKSIKITPEYIDKLKDFVRELWTKRQGETQDETFDIETKILELKASAQAIAEKIRYLSSEIAIRYMEEDLVKIEKEMTELEVSKMDRKKEETIDIELVLANVGYFLEHLEYLLLGSPNHIKRAAYFELIFDKLPTFKDLTIGTPSLAPYISLKEGFNNLLLPNCEPPGTRTQNHHLKRVMLYH